MNDQKSITVIKSWKKFPEKEDKPRPKIKRVAGYARVSTDKDEQFTSYSSQIDYYTKYILSHNDWQFVKVYTDEGVSGTNIKHRKGFKEMIHDALLGNIDLIVTKSISRFARNTVDSLTMIRKLKEVGCEVYFEKENIYTFDSKGELLITIMSSLAQEESRSISENVTWGARKRISDGKYDLNCSQFLGYIKNEDGEFDIDYTQAIIVRRIYLMCLQKMTLYNIAQELTKEKVPTPQGKSTWYYTVIKSILTNEKYTGDALLQKTFSTSFLTKKRKTNEGEVAQYYVKNGHIGIINREICDIIRDYLPLSIHTRHRSSDSYYSKKVRCGVCNNWYCKAIYREHTKTNCKYWRCNMKNNICSCKTPYITEKEMDKYFNLAKKELYNHYDIILKSIKTLTFTSVQMKAMIEEIDELTIYQNIYPNKENIDRIEELRNNIQFAYEINNKYEIMKSCFESTSLPYIMPNKEIMDMLFDYIIIYSKTNVKAAYISGDIVDLIVK